MHGPKEGDISPIAQLAIARNTIKFDNQKVNLGTSFLYTLETKAIPEIVALAAPTLLAWDFVMYA